MAEILKTTTTLGSLYIYADSDGEFSIRAGMKASITAHQTEGSFKTISAAKAHVTRFFGEAQQWEATTP